MGGKVDSQTFFFLWALGLPVFLASFVTFSKTSEKNILFFYSKPDLRSPKNLCFFFCIFFLFFKTTSGVHLKKRFFVGFEVGYCTFLPTRGTLCYFVFFRNILSLSQKSFSRKVISSWKNKWHSIPQACISGHFTQH